MKQLLPIIVTLLFHSIFCVNIHAADIIAKIKIVGVSVGMKNAHPNLYQSTTTGLPNFGRGSHVYLEAKAQHGTSIIKNIPVASATWAILSAPDGSSATIIPTDSATGLYGLSALFISDVIGSYEVRLDVITDSGNASTTMWLNAANYVGAGKIIDDTPNFPECSMCHSGQLTNHYDSWKTTGHASIFRKGIDGREGAHYDSNCVRCHTTGYDNSGTAMNDGFDDRATSLGWIFPTILQEGNWDTLKANYPELAKVANIQCESCHGPGSGHGGDISRNKIVKSFSADVCGMCHDAPGDYKKTLEWKTSAHAKAVGEPDDIEGMNKPACAICHTTQGFVLERIGGKPTAAPYVDAHGINCIACHDPHSKQFPHQVRKPLAELCTECHMTNLSAGELHHSTQGPMIAGVLGVPYTGMPDSGSGKWGGWQLSGYRYANSSHSGLEENCITCHMADSHADSLVGKLGGHTYRVSFEDENETEIINPKGCEDCHGVVSVEFVERSQNKVKSLLEQLRLLLPHKATGDTTQPLPPGDISLSQLQKAASYNYYFVLNDGSYGVHNHTYATGLLVSSIEQLQIGAGAAPIVAIHDVPNDQGKMVNIHWNKFPAEEFSIDKVISYGVWRKDEMAKTGLTTFSSYKEMFQKGKIGSSYFMNGDVWTFVGSVPAAKQPVYSFDVPTLFDSTISHGMKWTTFYVTGHSTNLYVVYASAPDSGYSLDNLVPTVPVGVGARMVSGGVELRWEISEELDFNYYAVYRGTTPNFIPGEPIGEVTDAMYQDNNVVDGQRYYYKLASFDFSGNQSAYSAELEVNVLDVLENGIPETFALGQNYPNPFNPSTSVKYQVPQTSHVRLIVYNTLGVEVARLVDETLEAGYYTISWDGKDNLGKSVSTGIYLCKMAAGTFTDVKKMIYVK
ncbi:MAG: T9SS type A sorting domain-containing protein [Ignavibacteriae bacterium]|nr:T9SS type A sorting domain-containing protein [Ignavibacteriota bacterium]